jgi:hypothetical protein
MHTESVLEGLDTIVEEPTAPEPVIDPSPPPDKPAAARDDAGKFKGKEGEKSEAAKPDDKAKDASKDDKTEPKTIPLATLLEERNRHKAEQEQTKATLKQLQEQIAALSAPPKKDPPPEPDFAADPKSYVDHRVKSAVEKLEGAQQQTAKTAEQAQAEAAQTRFMTQLGQTEQTFLAAQPDYYDALNHLRGIRIAEITTLNPELTQEQVIGALRHEELTLAAQLMRSGRDPHQVAYQLAKARGYTVKAKDAVPDKVLPNVPGQKVLPPDQTLGSGSGSPDASGETFLEDDEVFDRAMSEMFGKKRA